MPSEITSQQIDIISKYLIKMYYPKETNNSLSLSELKLMDPNEKPNHHKRYNDTSN